MSEFEVDLDAKFPVLPAGTYTVVITKAERREPREKGPEKFDNISLEMVVHEPEEFKNRQVYDTISLNPKVAPRLALLIKATGQAAGMGGRNKFRTEDLVGACVVITGKPNEFNGMERFKPGKYEMHPETAKAIEAQMNAGSASTPAAPAAPQAAPVASRPALPFKLPVKIKV